MLREARAERRGRLHERSGRTHPVRQVPRHVCIVHIPIRRGLHDASNSAVRDPQQDLCRKSNGEGGKNEVGERANLPSAAQVPHPAQEERVPRLDQLPESNDRHDSGHRKECRLHLSPLATVLGGWTHGIISPAMSHRAIEDLVGGEEDDVDPSADEWLTYGERAGHIHPARPEWVMLARQHRTDSRAEKCRGKAGGRLPGRADSQEVQKEPIGPLGAGAAGRLNHSLAARSDGRRKCFSYAAIRSDDESSQLGQGFPCSLRACLIQVLEASP